MKPDPIIICDTREKCPLTFTRFASETGTLQSGDYSIKGLEHLFTIERKSIQDAVKVPLTSVNALNGNCISCEASTLRGS